MNKNVRSMTMRLPSEMFYGRKLDQYWSEVKEKAKNYYKSPFDEEDIWSSIVAGYLYTREMMGMTIEESIKELEKTYPWNGNQLTEQEKEAKDQKDQKYVNRRDLEEIAYHAFARPLAEISEEEYWILDRYIPPILEETWKYYEPVKD